MVFRSIDKRLFPTHIYDKSRSPGTSLSTCEVILASFLPNIYRCKLHRLSAAEARTTGLQIAPWRNTKSYNVRYSNEILAKWMAHPNSMFYSNGIVNDITIPFIYNGTQYEEEHTGEYVDNDFSFEKGHTYEMALTGETITFNGRNVPLYYHEYFYLSPADSNPWQVNARNGRYFYVYSRDFVSGFSNQASPEWKKIFDFVY